MALKLKTVEVSGQTYAAVTDGKPVYINDDGSELAYDAPASAAKIAALNREAQGHREAKEGLEAKIKAFGDLDPEAARKAIETVSNLDDSKLIAAGKAEEMRQAAVKTVTDQYSAKMKELEDSNGKLTSALHGEKITNAFANSKFIGEKLVLPAPAAQAIFGGAFKVEGDKIAAYDKAGNKIYSQERPGEDPNFDEAFGILVNSYPYKDSLLKGKGHQGGGGQGGGAGGAGGRGTMTRDQFNKLTPADQMSAMTGTNRVEVVDG